MTSLDHITELPNPLAERVASLEKRLTSERLDIWLDERFGATIANLQLEVAELRRHLNRSRMPQRPMTPEELAAEMNRVPNIVGTYSAVALTETVCEDLSGEHC